MTRISGSQISVGMGKEATRGTAVAATYWYPKVDFDFEGKNDKTTDKSSYGVLENVSSAHIVKKWAEGSLKGNVYVKGIGYLLTALFGASPTSTVVETTAKKHAYAVAQNNTHSSLTLTYKEPNQDLRYAMAMIDSFKISYVVGDYINIDVKFVSKASASATNTVSFVVDTKFLPSNVVFKLATNLAGLTAATAVSLVSMELEFKKNLVQNQVLGSVELENICNTNFEVTGKIEKYYDDAVYKGYDDANTHKALRFDLIDTSTTVGATTNPSLRFDFAEVVFKNWSKGMGNTDIVTETMDIQALWNLTAASMVTAELVNDVASY